MYPTVIRSVCALVSPPKIKKVKNNTIFHKITIEDGKSKIVEKYHEYYHDYNEIIDPRFKVVSITTDFKDTFDSNDERILVVLQK